MAIPWLIGLGVAAVAAAILSDDEKEKQEERERQARRDARREEERLAQEAENKRQQFVREQAEREKREKIKLTENFALQKSGALVQEYGLPVSATDITRAVLVDSKRAEELLLQSFTNSKGYQQIHADIEKSLEQVAHIERCLTVLES